MRRSPSKRTIVVRDVVVVFDGGMLTASFARWGSTS